MEPAYRALLERPGENALEDPPPADGRRLESLLGLDRFDQDRFQRPGNRFLFAQTLHHPFEGDGPPELMPTVGPLAPEASGGPAYGWKRRSSLATHRCRRRSRSCSRLVACLESATSAHPLSLRRPSEQVVLSAAGARVDVRLDWRYDGVAVVILAATTCPAMRPSMVDALGFALVSPAAERPKLSST